MAGEVALEQPGGVAAALAFGDPSRDVVPGRGVVLAAVQNDRVQCRLSCPVAGAHTQTVHSQGTHAAATAPRLQVGIASDGDTACGTTRA